MQVDVHLSCQLLLTTVFGTNSMGWLSLTYVSDPNIIFLTPTDNIDRIILSLFAMWDYNRLNKQKEALCAKEGITNDRADEFKDMGDDSPLFRYDI